MKWDWILIVVCFVLLAVMYVRKSYYAPPRESTTVLPFVEPSANAIAEATGPYSNSNIFPIQSDVFKDASGWLNMREHPLTDFFQVNAFSNVGTYGSFVGLESSSGNAPMSIIPFDEQYSYGKIQQSCNHSLLVVNNTKYYAPNTYSNIDLTGDLQVWAPLTITATGPNNARQVMSFKSNEPCPEREHVVLDKEKTFNTIEITDTIQLQYIQCRKSVVRIDDKEYGPGKYTNVNLNGVIEVWAPLKIVATGPNGAREQLSYSTTEDCPISQRLTLDTEKTFDTIEITV